jgi:cytochrome c oxidase subunit IV
MAQEGQEHPISTYLWVWILLFVLSAYSYAVDYVGFQGFTRWSLVILFMFLKAYFIWAVFMHMVWERMALVLALFIPTFAIIVFVGIMGFEGLNTLAFGSVVIICSYLINELSIFLNKTLRCSDVLLVFL